LEIKAYQFKDLPFGLNVVFTKLLKPVAAFLRKRGIRLVLYLYDMLIIGSSVQETTKFTQIAMDLLTSLGFTIHKEKSITTPTQIITFLGFIINSNSRQISLPSEKVKRTLILCSQMLMAKSVSLCMLAVPVLTIYLGGAIASPPQGKNSPPPSKAISAPEVRRRIAHDCCQNCS
jgi:hypothetical protein